MAFCAGTTPTSPMAFSRASTAWSRPPRPRLEATDQPATSRRSSTSSPASSNSAYPPETARSHVIEVYHRPHDPDRPVVCVDETSKQLIIETRTPIPAKPGRPRRVDYE